MVKNMPRVRSQDGLNICFGFAAWTLFNQAVCKESDKDQNNPNNCLNLDPKKTISPLHLASYSSSEKNRGAKGFDRIPYNEGGASGSSLKGLFRNELAYAESCYAYDQFVNKYKNDKERMNAAFEKLRTKYFSNTEGSVCVDCLVKDLDQNFSIKSNNQEVLKALGSRSFDKFLFDIIFNKCEDVVDVGRKFTINAWPSTNNPSADETLNKIKEILATNTPLSIGACLDKKSASLSARDCDTGHDFVISGYRKFCKPDNTCREALKIQNSWGEDWQQDNNDGWVDAQNLLQYTDKGQNSIVWLSKK